MDKINIGKDIKALIDSIKEDANRIENFEEVSWEEKEQLFDKISSLYKKSIVYNHLISVEDGMELPQEKNVQEQIENIEEILMHAEPEVVNNHVLEIVPEEIQTVVEAVETTAGVDANIIVDLKEETITAVLEIPETEIKPLPKAANSSFNKIQKPPLSDIKSAIGINDKFQFINELFGGNVEEFNNGIQMLNTSETIENAVLYLSRLEQKFNWKVDNEAAKRLSELVERRYL
ncbi:MAG: hypothetical protein V4608_04020 [Bacteroidota bacterium]